MHPVLKELQIICDRYGSLFLVDIKHHVARADWNALSKLDVRPEFFTNARNYSLNNAIVCFVKKCQGLVDADSLHEQAIDTFLQCEKHNAGTNARLSRLALGPYVPADLPLLDFISSWRKNIRAVLGRLPETLVPVFSTGATYLNRGDKKTLPDKLSDGPHGTRAANYLFAQCEQTAWHLITSDRRQLPEELRGNRFTSVPKDSFKNRGICVEPLINISYQLYVGRFLKNRLRRFGLDLTGGAERQHREIARLSSISGEFATLDLSNASDTISRKLVELVLPRDWLELLMALRCPFTKIGEREYYLEKFSSMGNGFTFELETLLYFTLAQTVCGTDSFVSAYGDDIIVPGEHAASMAAALAFFGFQINRKKSFSKGPFRESCGGDYFNGVPVRGPYMKQLPSAPEDWISLHNQLVAYRSQDPQGPDVFRSLRDLARSSTPSTIRACEGPSYLGDICFHTETWEDKIVYRKTRWHQPLEDHRYPTPHVRTYQPLSARLLWSHWSDDVRLACAVLGSDPHRVTPSASVTGHALRWTELSTLLPCGKPVTQEHVDSIIDRFVSSSRTLWRLRLERRTLTPSDSLVGP